MAIRPDHLARLTHHRWSLPVLAQLHELDGAKFVQLVARTGAHHGAVAQAVDALIEIRLIMPNPGYGHPMRPEYVLTALGRAVAPACARVHERLVALHALDVGLRKWTLPTVLAMRDGAARFSELRVELDHATDRALALTLSGMIASKLALRHEALCEARREIRYRLPRRALALADPLAELPDLPPPTA